MAGKSFKLIGFNARGGAEVSRYLFAISKTKYDDSRFPIEFGTPGDFSTIKREAWEKAKAEGIADVSMQVLPILEVDGVKIGQSKTIARYLARTLGMAGESPTQEALIDMMCEHVRDIMDAYNKVKANPGDAGKEKAMETFFGETLPQKSKALDKAASVAGLPAKINLADVQLYFFYTQFFDNVDGAKASLKDCPTIAASVAKVAENPEVLAWEKARPPLPF